MADSNSDSRLVRAAHLRALPGGLGAPRDPFVFLQIALEEVRLATADSLRETHALEEISGVLDWIAEGIEAHRAERDVAAFEGNTTLARFLLERVSSALIVSLSERPEVDRDGALRMIRGLDALRGKIEPDWERYFGSQIAGPDGLAMVTEVLHDLRSPLTSIRCLSEMLERGQSGPVTEIQRRQLRLIYSAALGIGSMATDVIEMARQGEQAAESERVPFSVAEVLEGVAAMVRPIAEEKGLLIRLGSLKTDQRIGMPHALGRVLLNLVTNALKFTDVGTVEVSLRAISPARVEFSVIDTGHGIPDAAVPHLFRSFRRAAGRPGGSGYLFSGTGLGLALCRKLVRRMGAELRFESKENVGTRFYFELDLPPQASR